MKTGVLAAACAVAGGPGCLSGDVQGIPCGEDLHCATGAFCDRVESVCIADEDDRGPPDVHVVAIEADGARVATPFIPPDATTTLKMVVQNVGGYVATDITLRMGELQCMNLIVDPSTVPAQLPPGEEARVDFTVTPQLCSMLSIQDWFFAFSRRGSRGTFNIVVERAPPAAD
jgi:hypothetical protein